MSSFAPRNNVITRRVSAARASLTRRVRPIVISRSERRLFEMDIQQSITMQSRNYNPKKPIVVANVCPEAHELLKPVLDQWFGDAHHALEIDEATDPGKLIRTLVTGKGKWKKSVKCVSAVFDQRVSMGVPECLPAKHQLVTFVGDPFTLAVAEYQRQLGEPNFWYRGQQVEFSQCFPTVDSFLDRYPDWLYSRLPQNLTLANLPQKLGRDFLFVGVLESLQESVNQLAEIIDQPAVELASAWGAGETAVGSDSLRQKFYAQYPRPKAIYDFARSAGAGSDEIDSNDSVSNSDSQSASAGLHGPHGGKVTTGKLDLQLSSSAD